MSKFFVRKRSSGISAYVEGLQLEGAVDEVGLARPAVDADSVVVTDGFLF